MEFNVTEANPAHSESDPREYIHTVKIEVQQQSPLIKTLSVAERSEQGSPDKYYWLSRKNARENKKPFVLFCLRERLM